MSRELTEKIEKPTTLLYATIGSHVERGSNNEMLWITGVQRNRCLIHIEKIKDRWLEMPIRKGGELCHPWEQNAIPPHGMMVRMPGIARIHVENRTVISSKE